MILAPQAHAALTLIGATTGSTDQVALDPQQFWGIPVALVGAAFLAFGAQYQSRGLNQGRTAHGPKRRIGVYRYGTCCSCSLAPHG